MSDAYLTAKVVRVAQHAPSVLRITFAVPGFASCGFADEWVWIFFGEPGDHKLRRNYSVRAIRADTHEVDIEFILHAGGLAVDWARAARPGDELVWGEVNGSYAPPADTEWRLLVADQAGLPALGRIVEELPAGARAIVVAEVQDERVGRPWETAGEVETTWLRGSGGGRTPSRLDQAVRTFPEPAGRGYYWMAGETRTVRAARRYLRHERGLARERYSLTGYWMTIGAERWMERYEQMSEQLDAIWARADVDGTDPEDLMDDYDAALEDAGL